MAAVVLLETLRKQKSEPNVNAKGDGEDSHREWSIYPRDLSLC